eukprot:TRINITY_DN59531_c0_g1_i1.p1 TRINITY_DN59531_c0_g1~~TRINITY_DN59531_c0_g1_i1.p1  ORF type:complete len:891 (-),score=243.76 TRINITY_DN59531_c0_g1_i1:125-2743(-)
MGLATALAAALFAAVLLRPVLGLPLSSTPSSSKAAVAVDAVGSADVLHASHFASPTSVGLAWRRRSKALWKDEPHDDGQAVGGLMRRHAAGSKTAAAASPADFAADEQDMSALMPLRRHGRPPPDTPADPVSQAQQAADDSPAQKRPTDEMTTHAHRGQRPAPAPAPADMFIYGSESERQNATSGWFIDTSGAEPSRSQAQHGTLQACLLMVGGTVLATLLMILSTRLGFALSASAVGASDEERLQMEIDLMRAQAQQLQEQLDERRLAMASPPGGDGDAPAAPDAPPETEAAAAVPQDEAQPAATFEELMGELTSQTQGIDAVVDEAARTKGVQAVIRSSHRVRETVQVEVDQLQGKVETFAEEVGTNFITKVKAAVKDADMPAEFSPENLDKAQEMMSEFMKTQTEEAQRPPIADDFSPPPLSILIGAVMARSQVQQMQYSSWSAALFHSLFFIIGFGIFFMDKGRPCGDIRVQVWMVGMLLWNAVLVVCNAAMQRRCETVLKADDAAFAEREMRLGPAQPDNLLGALWKFQQNRAGFLNLLVRLDELENSTLSALTLALGLVSWCWDLYSVYIVQHDIVTMELHCNKRELVLFVETYAFIVVVLLLYKLLSVFTLLFRICKGTRFMTRLLVTTARSLDDSVFRGLPVVLTLLRAFLIRDTSSLLVLEEDQIKQSIAELEKQLVEHQAKLEEQRCKAEKVELLREDAQRLDKEWLQAYNAKLEQAGTKLTPLVAMAAQLQAAAEQASSCACGATFGPQDTTCQSCGAPRPAGGLFTSLEAAVGAENLAAAQAASNVASSAAATYASSAQDQLAETAALASSAAAAQAASFSDRGPKARRVPSQTAVDNPDRLGDAAAADTEMQSRESERS